MSAIDDFLERHGTNRASIDDVVRQWNAERVSRDLADAVIVGGAMAADLISGDGFRDQVPQAVRDAVAHLAGNPTDRLAYDKARLAIQDVALKGEASIAGWISKYKGQVGEDFFASQLGPGVQLASSGSQAGYDVIRQTASGPEYIQVKLYNDPDLVLARMRELQQRVADGRILAEGTDVPVAAINWAVPHDIADQVRQAALQDPDLAGISVYSVGITADEAAAIMQSGMDAVTAEGVDRLGDFFGGLAGGVATAATLQAAFVGFLWWKGEREADEARQQLADGVVTSTAGFGVALAAEELADSLLFGGPAGFALGFTARQVVFRALSSRREFVRHNEKGNEHLERLVGELLAC